MSFSYRFPFDLIPCVARRLPLAREGGGRFLLFRIGRAFRSFVRRIIFFAAHADPPPSQGWNALIRPVFPSDGTASFVSSFRQRDTEGRHEQGNGAAGGNGRSPATAAGKP